jgi:IclR family pca regulon transcriptional regulator
MPTEMTGPHATAEPGLGRVPTCWGSALASFEGNPDFVLSLARGLRVIESFAGSFEGLTVTEISRRTGFSRAAVRRLLITLGLLGFVENAGSLYHLTYQVLRLSLSYCSSNSLSAIGQPTVQRITDELGEGSAVGVLDRDEVLFIAGAVTKRIVSPSTSMGIRLPAYCSSMGRVLLTGLPENDFINYVDRVKRERFTPKTIVYRQAFIDAVRRVAAQGYSIVDEELELGLRAISVPVLSGSGRVAASLGVAAHSSRVTLHEMQARFLPLLKEHARLIGQFAC